jgi:hypothetical protein
MVLVIGLISPFMLMLPHLVLVVAVGMPMALVGLAVLVGT